MNFSVTDTNSSRTSEAALWPSTYISPLSNSTPCIRKDRISSKSLMRLSICLNLSKQQQVSEIMRQMLTQAQTAGQYFTNDQIKEMTRKVSAEVDLVHQQTQNQRYGSSHIGATAKD